MSTTLLFNEHVKGTRHACSCGGQSWLRVCSRLVCQQSRYQGCGEDENADLDLRGLCWSSSWGLYHGTNISDVNLWLSDQTVVS